jgi:heat shock protein HslJ
MKLVTLSLFAVLVLFTSCKCLKSQTSSVNGNEITKSEAEMVNSSIKDTKWKLVKLMGKDVSDKNAYILFSSEENKVYGNASCNNFNGSYELNTGNQIKLSKIAATLMACPDMIVENEFMEILRKVDNYSINGKSMTLNKAKMAPMAVFVASEF